MLQTQFPLVPIMALSATCPLRVLKDLVEVLKLENPIVSGEDSPTKGTVYFTAPLYCKNLHYKVVPKPHKGEDIYQAMVDSILDKHRGKSGIVYCFSKVASVELVSSLLIGLDSVSIFVGLVLSCLVLLTPVSSQAVGSELRVASHSEFPALTRFFRSRTLRLSPGNSRH